MTRKRSNRLGWGYLLIGAFFAFFGVANAQAVAARPAPRLTELVALGSLAYLLVLTLYVRHAPRGGHPALVVGALVLYFTPAAVAMARSFFDRTELAIYYSYLGWLMLGIFQIWLGLNALLDLMRRP